MFDTRPSKENLELLKKSIANEAHKENLSESERAAESIVVGFLSRPGWRVCNNDQHVRIGDFVKRELFEGLGIDESQWKAGLSMLLKDKVLILGVSEDQKQHLPPNVAEISFPPVDRELPPYLLTNRVLELALKTLRQDDISSSEPF